MNDERFMEAAMKEATLAYEKGEVPIGAVIVKAGIIIGRGHNLREARQQAAAHAEMIAIDEACSHEKTWRLEDCTIYITLEPCPMCAGAIIQSRFKRLVYAAKDEKHGAHTSQINLFEPAYNHRVDIRSGVLKEESEQLLRNFFIALRNR